MLSKPFAPLVSCLILLVIAASLPAVIAAAPTAYQIEMLIFTHEDGNLADAGVPAQPLTEIQQAVELESLDGSDSFQPLPASELTLATAKSILNQSGRYEVIAHLAWRQPGLDEQAARAVHIHGGVDYQSPSAAPAPGYESPGLSLEASGPVTLEQLDGTIKVVLGQYLHVYTDLLLRNPVAIQTFGADQPPRQVNALHQFRIEQHRRMRSGELHYLDHPLLGILVQITPVKEPVASTPPADEPGAEALIKPEAS